METEAAPPVLGYFTSAMADLRYDKPDWSTLAEDVQCPLCQYNLRGLIDPRCPECGYQFRWPDLLDPSRRNHPYIFEHSICIFKPFWRTAWHGLKPGKFWTDFRADQDCRPRRLFGYWVLISALFMAAWVVLFLTMMLDVYLESPALFPSLRLDFRSLRFIALPVLTIYMWPLLTTLALFIFQASMRRAHVRLVHVVRCIVYSSDVVVWLASFSILSCVLLAGWMLVAFSMTKYTAIIWPSVPVASIWIIAWPVFVYRLIISYRYYLRFRHVIATVITSQVIVGLFVLIVASYVLLP